MDTRHPRPDRLTVRHRARGPRPVRPLVALLVGVTVAAGASLVPVTRAEAVGVPNWAGSCVFSASIYSGPPTVSFTPQLTSVSGSGLCAGNFLGLVPVTLSLSTASGTENCLGGTENMNGSITFGASTPTSAPTVNVLVAGGPGLADLAITDLSSGFVGHATLAWDNLPCGGATSTFVAPTTGAMTFASP